MESIKINGITLDVPDIEDLKKWDYGFEDKSKILWLNGYERDFKNGIFITSSHKLLRTTRGNLFLDDVKVTEGLTEGLKLFETFGKIYQKTK